ncbi:hypothetical protein [Streptomyces sp. t39]|uniref:hypothetical protein n=1 Tax=Streptomyces sp. t39 TaxID=1828156 RepID=UPI0011CD59FA|nr:hypothetical protein [Streptomyces sp. t39]TXS39686.1 hypothetical protein EAO77_36070 [Streptomyces sp. t39]
MTEPSMAWRARHVRITADGPGADVRLDDQDISPHVAGYTIEHRVGERPVVILHALPTGQAVFEGMAQVAVGRPANPAAAVVDFLQGIDPKRLEQAALERDDLTGERYDLARAMVAQLADWAQEGDT